ncbi:DUF3108 domain-containing protein [bacterium]|nr:DUF3108 domain-containing protein [bacterium]
MRILTKIQGLHVIGLMLFLTYGFSQIKNIDPVPVYPILPDSLLSGSREVNFINTPESQKEHSMSANEDSLNAIISVDSLESPVHRTDDGFSDTLGIDRNSKSIMKFRIIQNEAFGVGEYLEFEIGWKLFKAGIATMSVSDTVWYENRLCYHIKTTANSSSVIDVFYKVRDKVETIVDLEGVFPWKFEKHLREGHFRRDRYTIFDHFKNMAFVKNDTVLIPPYVQDILSSFYYVRTLPLQIGRHFDIENISDKKVYPLRVLVHRKETVKVPAGKFHCLVVEPVLRGEGLFNQKGRLTIWMTDDEHKIPVMMKSEVFIGTVDVKLKKYKNTLKG